MSLEWVPRDNEMKDPARIGAELWATEAPRTVCEKKPLVDPLGNR
jgi:hypothetical protein